MANEFIPFPSEQGYEYDSILPLAQRPIPYANALQPQLAVPGIIREPVNAIASMLQIPGEAARGELGQTPEQMMEPAARFAEGALTAGLAGSSLVGVPENSLGAQAFGKLKGKFDVIPVEHDPFAGGGTIRAYHGTDTDFENYTHGEGIGAHFGSTAQANMFATPNQFGAVGTPNVRPVDLTINNPLRLSDLHWEIPTGVSQKLYDAGVITGKQHNEIIEDSANRLPKVVQMNKLREWIKDKGYDGIVYRNEVEQPGTDSYIALDPKNQVKPAFGRSSSGLRAEEPIVPYGRATVSEEGGRVSRALLAQQGLEDVHLGMGMAEKEASAFQAKIDKMIAEGKFERVEHDPFAAPGAAQKFINQGGT